MISLLTDKLMFHKSRLLKITFPEPRSRFSYPPTHSKIVAPTLHLLLHSSEFNLAQKSNNFVQIPTALCKSSLDFNVKNKINTPSL